MRVFEHEQFDSVDDYESKATFSDFEFRHCTFETCAVGISRTLSRRSTFRNMRFIDCTAISCSVGPAILEDITVDGLKTQGPLFQIWAALFNRVVLKGRISPLMFCEPIPYTPFSESRNRLEKQLFAKQQADFYRNVDWALDISKAELRELDIRTIPGRLIRRDRETQALVKREKVMPGTWRDLEFHDPITPFSLNFLLERDVEDDVLIAAKRHPRFKDRVADIELLRKAGIAERD